MLNEAPGRHIFYLSLLWVLLCLSMMQLLWSKEARRNVTKFIYGQYSFMGLGDYFTVQSCSQGNSLHIRIHRLPRGFISS